MHQAPNPKHWQLNILNLLKTTSVCLLHLSVNLIFKYLALSRLLYLYSLLSRGISKLILVIAPLLLLCFSFNAQALSAITSKVIHGSAPYFTFDNGITKVTTTDGLLGITVSDGNTKTTYTPTNNPSTAVKPIVLPKENQSFADIGMLVPTNTTTISLNALIGAPYNYWGDDDGDGQGANGITANGYLSLRITNKDNNSESHSASLDICKAPYKVVLSSTNGSLTTQYGAPNSSSFSDSTVTYYISPKGPPKICYARPSLSYGTGKMAGPATIWNPDKGFLLQSTEPSSYSRNFPTTGANNLYFDLDVGGVKGSALTWTTVSQGGITATMTPSPANANYIRVTLTGPAATAAQQESATPDSVATPSLPQTFVLVGKDSSNNEVVRYGFVLKQWFVNRGDKRDTVPNHSSWCSNLGGGYRLPQVKDLTNAKCGVSSWFPCLNGIDGATPLSNWNGYQRNIGAGLFTEWGYMYTAGFLDNYYWSSDSNGSYQFGVYPRTGDVVKDGDPSNRCYGVCAYP